MSNSRIDRPPLKLFVATPEFKDGDVIQTTVRLGPKWRDDLKGSYRPRVPVFVTGGDGESIGTAEITGDLFGLFKNYAEIGSKSNHQKSCRKVKGLVKVLEECYPDFDPETSQVTILFFKFTPIEVVEETVEEAVEEEIDYGNEAGETIDGDTEVAGESPTDETTTEESSDGSTEETDSGAEESDGEESSSETGESSESEEGSDS